MASVLQTIGTPAAVTTAINAMTAGAGLGSATQLAQVQAVAIQQVNAFATSAKLNVIVECNKDVESSKIVIVVQPCKSGPDGIFMGTQATQGGFGP